MRTNSIKQNQHPCGGQIRTGNRLPTAITLLSSFAISVGLAIALKLLLDFALACLPSLAIYLLAISTGIAIGMLVFHLLHPKMCLLLKENKENDNVPQNAANSSQENILLTIDTLTATTDKSCGPIVSDLMPFDLKGGIILSPLCIAAQSLSDLINHVLERDCPLDEVQKAIGELAKKIEDDRIKALVEMVRRNLFASPDDTALGDAAVVKPIYNVCDSTLHGNDEKEKINLELLRLLLQFQRKIKQSISDEGADSALFHALSDIINHMSISVDFFLGKSYQFFIQYHGDADDIADFDMKYAQPAIKEGLNMLFHSGTIDANSSQHQNIFRNQSLQKKLSSPIGLKDFEKKICQNDPANILLNLYKSEIVDDFIVSDTDSSRVKLDINSTKFCFEFQWLMYGKPTDPFGYLETLANHLKNFEISFALSKNGTPEITGSLPIEDWNAFLTSAQKISAKIKAEQKKSPIFCSALNQFFKGEKPWQKKICQSTVQFLWIFSVMGKKFLEDTCDDLSGAENFVCNDFIDELDWIRPKEIDEKSPYAQFIAVEFKRKGDEKYVVFSPQIHDDDGENDFLGRFKKFVENFAPLDGQSSAVTCKISGKFLEEIIAFISQHRSADGPTDSTDAATVENVTANAIKCLQLLDAMPSMDTYTVQLTPEQYGQYRAHCPWNFD
ncbi:MAG: hypothetical protein LBI69_02990 [Puniceicoccales bacterium]|jgi:hypothetical protein|nr:hypothetical protein [Puniceicoccales bacterium]